MRVIRFALLALFSAAAFAQPAPTMRLRGTIEKVDATSVVVKERNGETMTVALPDNLTVSEVLPLDPAAIQSGKFIGTAAYDENVPPTLDPVTLVVNEPEAAINQDQTDTLLAHESFGEGFDTSETLLIGQVVVCISPSKNGTKLPGAWTKQNGYTGDKCTTVWYNGGATVGVSNLNTGSHNWVTVPIV